MKIRSERVIPSKKKTAMLCCFVLENSTEPLGLPRVADPKINSTIKSSIKQTKGKLGSLSVIHTHGQLPAHRILLAGLGKKTKLTNDTLRIVSGKIAQMAQQLELAEFSIIFPKNLVKGSETSGISQIVQGAHLSMYYFDKYKKEKDKKKKKKPALYILNPESANVKATIKTAQTIAEGTVFTKNIANLPPNECSPGNLAGFAKSLASKNKLKCHIFSKNELKRKGFGGISAVGRGSKNEPKLIILEYNNAKTTTRQNKQPVVIVGKAVTFDTGGISLKPSEKMDEMKFDKCGGCTVLGIMKVVSELRLPINLVGIIPSVENMPSGQSYRPGDIIRLYNGKQAEILNTDAEGRLILADALAYGEKKYSPRAIIDFATLTGACIVALGTNVAAMISNDDSLAKKIQQASQRTAEEVWQLPLNDDYMDMIKSDVADIKNIGPGRVAGTITAAAFLANAIKNTPWAHLDIAGVAWTQTATKPKPYNPKGATGFGVRLILDYLLQGLR